MTTALADAALAIAGALFDSLWEGALIAGAVWLALRCLPKLGAATRYGVWLCTLAALVVIPLVTNFAPRPQPLQPAIARMAGSRPERLSAVPATRAGIETARTAHDPAANVQSATAAVPLAPPSPLSARITIPASLAVAAVLAWLLLAGTRGVMLLLNLRELAVIRRDTHAWSSAHEYPILVSHRVEVPLAVGFLRPAILLPTSVVEELSAGAVDTIVAHEVAHLRRYDVWTNALARILEAAVAFNPVAWFVVRRLSIEREIACDDWVVERLGAGDVFARALASLAGRVGCRTPLAAPSAIGSRHSVVERIERLLDSRPRRLRLSPSVLGGTLVLLAIVALVLQSVSPVLAYAPQSNVPAQVVAASGCAVANRALQVEMPFVSNTGKLTTIWMNVEPAATILAKFGAAHTATVQLTVDAKGIASKVDVLSAPSYPGMAEYVSKMFIGHAFEPALRNCVPIASTILTGVRIGTPHPNTLSIVTPSYPDGWSDSHVQSCKVPPLLHTGMPQFPDSMKNIPMLAKYGASVRVHVDAGGRATSAAIVTSSGQAALDDALLDAARAQTYPLAESTGFKPVRPSGAPPYSWNAAHGYALYSKCSPLPADYVWSTTFDQVVPQGILGSSADALFERG